MSIEFYGGKQGQTPDLSISKCKGRSVGNLMLLYDERTDRQVDASRAARQRRREVERRKSALAARYGCRVLRHGISFDEASQVSTCWEPFTADGPNWEKLLKRLDQFLRREPDADLGDPRTHRCLGSRDGRRWQITVWRRGVGKAVIASPGCSWAGRDGLLYSDEGTALLDSIESLVVRPTDRDLWRMGEIPPSSIPQGHRPLTELGELRLTTYSIHGLAPLVVLFTEAPSSASDAERRYRGQVTRVLWESIKHMPVSLFSLRTDTGRSDSSRARQLTEVFEVFRRIGPWEQPQVIIGFGDDATAAAQILLTDSLRTGLVALVPFNRAAGASAGERTIWEEFLGPTKRSRDVLVIESACNRSSSRLAETTFQHRQLTLILPQYDGWLSQRRSATCPAMREHGPLMGYELIALLTDWVRRTLRFPE